MKTKVADWISFLRVSQYTKNFFVLSPLFFSFKFRNLHLLGMSLAGFVLYCLTASCVYIVNDITDLKEDARHPIKRLRALPSGKVSVNAAKIMAVTLFIVAFSVSFYLNIVFALILATYFILNVLYSLKLKRFSIMDIIIIALGFVLRIYAGGAIVNVVPSMWLTLMTFLLSLILALGKRRDDVLLRSEGVKMRSSIKGYNLEFLNYSIITMAGVTIVCYIQYTISPEIIVHFHNPYLYCNIIFVIAGFLRYFQAIFVKRGTSNPSKIVLKDYYLQIDILLWLCSFVIFLR